jgi:cell division inhibitor SulA
LSGQGHDLVALLDGYPATAVKGLLAASRMLKRRHLVEHTMALTVAVSGALDLALNRGKGKVLEKWMEEMMKEEEKNLTRKAKMSERAFSFFTAMPRRQHQ